jgi:hypothetical protein
VYFHVSQMYSLIRWKFLQDHSSRYFLFSTEQYGPFLLCYYLYLIFQTFRSNSFAFKTVQNLLFYLDNNFCPLRAPMICDVFPPSFLYSGRTANITLCCTTKLGASPRPFCFTSAKFISRGFHCPKNNKQYNFVPVFKATQSWHTFRFNC